MQRLCRPLRVAVENPLSRGGHTHTHTLLGDAVHDMYRNAIYIYIYPYIYASCKELLNR